ncbi:hypothetical protein RDI58_000556 [Solanum bulbocastanum]|uniref:Uncharacterized protein n=1 Tax=Solanum bulbocastanum TaxID=147425 RepID=A0AAN8U7M0_SOLBU
MFPLPNFEDAWFMLHIQQDILLHLQDPSVVGAEQSSSGFCSVDKLIDVVEVRRECKSRKAIIVLVLSLKSREND